MEPYSKIQSCHTTYPAFELIVSAGVSPHRAFAANWTGAFHLRMDKQLHDPANPSLTSQQFSDQSAMSSPSS